MTDPDKDPARIAGMFDAIAARYDLLNHLLSAGFDRRWRTRAVEALQLTGTETVADVCTGTADLAVAAVRGRQAARVVGIDFAREMLRRAQMKLRRRSLASVITLLRGDAARLPLASESVDAVTMAFGIRNVEEAALACAEMHRVLRPGGRAAVLEFGIPGVPGLRQIYLWYFGHLLPWIGRLISRHETAYSYLPASVSRFFRPEEFSDLLREAGFARVEISPLSFGIVYLYVAEKE